MEYEDVPPLEDLTEVVHRARTQLRHESRMRSEPREAAIVAEKRGVAGAGATRPGEEKPQLFGGFSKGFLISPSSSIPKKHSPKDGASKQPSASVNREANSAADNDIPFLKPQDIETKGPVFPEVQEAMKEAYPLLNTQEWVTETLLEKMEKHPVLSKALRDPNLSRVMSQFQSDPQTVLRAAAGNPEMQTFLKEFCSLMGDHFTELADKQESRQSTAAVPDAPLVDEEVQRVLGQKGVKEALADPQIQQLIRFLNEDRNKAQRILSSASSELRQRVQLLIDNGLLAIQ